MEAARNMDPKTLRFGDRIQHPDFGEGVATFQRPALLPQPAAIEIDWDKQGQDTWPIDDKRWEQVLLA